MSPFASPTVRVLAVLAASSLVLAFALAVTMPLTATLAQLIARWRPSGVAGLEEFMVGNLPAWAWDSVMLPVLSRPCWLMPVEAALVFGGIATTVALRGMRTAERRRG